MSGQRDFRFLSLFLNRRAGIAMLGSAVAGVLPASANARQSEPCDCEQVGVTGGGVVRTDIGDASLVLFASRLVDAGTPPTGVVRWNDPNVNGGLRLENDGAIVYEPVEGQPLTREVSGVAKVNGDRLEPFRLLVTVRDDAAGTPCSCVLEAGDSIGGGSSGWSYAAKGDLIGGELVLLGEPAPAT